MMEFDNKWQQRFNGFYGRYVDDFYIIAPKEMILEAMSEIAHDLSLIGVTLHPNKRYLQHYSKGIKFTGATVKMGRRYVNKSTVHNFRRCIAELNAIEDKEAAIKNAVERINSYLGYFGHYNSYALRIEVMKTLSPEWRKYIYLTGPCQKVVIRNKYKKAV